MFANNQVIANDLQEKVELFLSFRSSHDLLSHNSSGIKVNLYIAQNDNFSFFDCTEVVKNSSPDFTKSFILDYFFETSQKLKFEIVSVEGHENRLIGEIYTTLGGIIGSSNQNINKGFDIMVNGQSIGNLIVRFEKVDINNQMAKLKFKAELNRASGGWLSYFDVFGYFTPGKIGLKLYRTTNDQGYAAIYETNTVDGSNMPSWNEFEIRVSKLCNSDFYRPIKARIFENTNHGENLIGECEFTLNEIVEGEKRKFTIVDSSKHRLGHLYLEKFFIIQKDHFLDYIKGGTQLNVMVGVDFTASNGNPHDPSSLHAVRMDGVYNEYQQAISSVCNILLDYDNDKKVIMCGFGGKPRFPNSFSNVVQHCFALTGNPNDPWAYNLDGIMQTYNYALQNVELSGPTLFAPLLTEAMRIAQNNKNNGSEEYTILLIITDGEIHDMENTINNLIKSAKLPLSVIIVGVGSADFTNMEILDGDDGLHNSNGVEAERDLVQFVPFKDFKNSPEMLAKHVLEEIPTQLVDYMHSVGIKPKPVAAYQVPNMNMAMEGAMTDSRQQMYMQGQNPSATYADLSASLNSGSRAQNLNFENSLNQFQNNNAYYGHP